jgi:putative PIN family toxin of toxin-antitoxin system
VTSDILDEYFAVINRPKFHLKQETVDRIIRYIYQVAEFVVPSETIPTLEADPKDTMFLAAAVAGHVDAIVSGDAHLLELKAFQGIPILSAREFLETL